MPNDFTRDMRTLGHQGVDIYIYIYIYFNNHLKPHYIHRDGTIYSSGMWATQRDKIFLQLRYLNFEFNCLQYKREALHSRTWFYYTLLDH